MEFFKLKTLIERSKLTCLINILTQKLFFFNKKKPILLKRKGKLVFSWPDLQSILTRKRDKYNRTRLD